MLRSVIATVVVASCFLLPASVGAYYSLGEPTGFVTDQVGILSPVEEEGLEHAFSRLNQETGVEFAVVIVKDLKGDTIENFSLKLFQEWGIGEKGKDNGLLLFIACCSYPSGARFEVGYGLEGAIPDLLAKDMAEYIMAGRGDWLTLTSRIFETTARIFEIVKAEVPVQTPKEPIFRDVYSYDYGEFAKWFIYFIVFNLIAAAIVAALGLGGLWWFGAVIGGVFGYLTLGWLGAIAVALVGLLIDFAINKRFTHRRAGVDAWLGKTQAPGASDFGGFGGGRSGGGGASA